MKRKQKGDDCRKTYGEKQGGGREFLETTAEKAAVNLLDVRREGRHIFLLGVTKTERWIRGGMKPKQPISGNGREFALERVKEICGRNEIGHIIHSAFFFMLEIDRTLELNFFSVVDYFDFMKCFLCFLSDVDSVLCWISVF